MRYSCYRLDIRPACSSLLETYWRWSKRFMVIRGVIIIICVLFESHESCGKNVRRANAELTIYRKSRRYKEQCVCSKVIWFGHFGTLIQFFEPCHIFICRKPISFSFFAHTHTKYEINIYYSDWNRASGWCMSLLRLWLRKRRDKILREHSY